MLNHTFLENKYTRWYFSIINSSKNRQGYTEKHHILPVCLYPQFKNLKKNPWNCAVLTAREHFICHWLLTKMVSSKKEIEQMKRAFGGMSLSKTKRNLSAKQYEIAKKISVEQTKEALTGITLNQRYSEDKADEIRHKRSTSNIGIKKPSKLLKEAAIRNAKIASDKNVGSKRSEETKLKMSDTAKGVPKSEQARINMSITRKSRMATGEIKSPKQKQVSYKGVVYQSVIEAATVYASDHGKVLGTARIYVKKDPTFFVLGA